MTFLHSSPFAAEMWAGAAAYVCTVHMFLSLPPFPFPLFAIADFCCYLYASSIRNPFLPEHN